MAGRPSKVVKVQCPCCQATLEIDTALGAVLHFTAHERPREFSDLEAAVERQRGEAGRREEAFRLEFLFELLECFEECAFSGWLDAITDELHTPTRRPIRRLAANLHTRAVFDERAPSR